MPRIRRRSRAHLAAHVRKLRDVEERGYREHGDDAGGNVCLQFGKHLWNAVSLDRIDNSLAHFPDPANLTRNVRFVMAALRRSHTLGARTDHGTPVGCWDAPFGLWA